jgi:hypothetical protein
MATTESKSDTKPRKQLGNIKGWGADLEAENRPGIPRELDAANVLSHPQYKEIVKQVPDVKIFVTVERDSITPVFGTSSPPRLLSGLIRGYAYRFSEARLARWMTLLLADRVDIVESSFIDLLHFKWPRNRYFYGVLGIGAVATGVALSRRRKLRLKLNPGLAPLLVQIEKTLNEAGFATSRRFSRVPASAESANLQ